jgi:alkanesulfonate monooxygenase SsuD/methylene tetrahydromethanopterin reductase-like flavin-dependent oxidoreductase (luciferase family)
MEFGICVAAKIDEVGLLTHAENLGYSHGWVTDTHMIWSDCYAVLALAAQQTRRMRIGTGVSVAGTRIAPVTANSIATINRLAPGRTFLGLGTGNTAMRLMGQRPLPLKAFEDYLRVVRDLLSGGETAFTWRGRTTQIRFRMQELGFLGLEPPIPIYVSGFGPRAQGLAGAYGDGLVFGIPRGGSVSQALANARAGAERAGRSLDDFHVAALANLLLLEPGEGLDSERAVRTIGPAVMANVHYVYDKIQEDGGEPPDYVRGIWKAFCALMAAVPRERLHQRVHDSHYMFLHPEEARLVTPGLIRATALAGPPGELIDRLRDYEREGLQQMLFLGPLDQQYRMVEDFARQVMERY